MVRADYLHRGGGIRVRTRRSPIAKRPHELTKHLTVGILPVLTVPVTFCIPSLGNFKCSREYSTYVVFGTSIC